MVVSKASRKQLNIIRDLARIIFPHTYANILSSEQLDYMLDMMYSVSSLEKQMSNHHVFLLAEDDGEFLGYASYELNCKGSGKTKLHKIYILPQTQGKGVGKKLLSEVEEAAKQAGDSHVFLNVNRNNNAQDFYKRMGFHTVGEENINIGNGYLMEDFVMEKLLS